MKGKIYHTILLILAVHIAFSPYSVAQPDKLLHSGELRLELKKLAVLGSVLYIAAHPDDENTAFLAWCAKERLLRTGYLSLTRGSGGQNLIGQEYGDALGVLRTQELLSARRIDGAEQFFTRAVDFGYSKTVEESLDIWGRDSILSDIVKIIREFRPDVIVTRFPESGNGGHGHHTASAVLAVEAFQAAADPARFPGQLKTLQPWQAKRVLWNGWLSGLEQHGKDMSKVLSVDLGAWNPLLGTSYTELAARSRSMHKSQGFGSLARRGQVPEFFDFLAGDSARGDLFDGVDMTWNRIEDGRMIGHFINESLSLLDPDNPSPIVHHLFELRRLLKEKETIPWVKTKLRDLDIIIRSAAGLWVEAIAADYSSAPGTDVEISLQIINRSEFPFSVREIRWPDSKEELPDMQLRSGYPFSVLNVVRIPENTPVTQPFWLRNGHPKGRYRTDPALSALPYNPPALSVTVSLAADPEVLDIPVPVLYRWRDAVHGEKYRPFSITPKVAVNFENEVFVFPDDEARTISLNMTSYVPEFSGTLALELPNGWSCSPETISFTTGAKYSQQSFSFDVTAPPDQASGIIRTVVDSAPAFSTLEMDYEHFPPQQIFSTAEASLVHVPITRAVKRIGYVMGSGDRIPDYLAQAGFEITLLEDRDLEKNDLSLYDAVVTGIRAYNTREHLMQQHTRLMEYVKNGGTLLVQHNTLFGRQYDQLGPRPFTVSRDRVSVEQSPVSFDEDHPVFRFPHRITAADFENWVQERGLYFAGEWDESYETPLECADPGEEGKRGGLLYARHGKGIFIYTGLSFFRQLPAGVPGAYRLFVNLISAGKNDSGGE